jgi:23S rRNA (cytosine1962-C5)-methyltransferase
MTLSKPTATLSLKPGREKPVLNRHPWVFSGAIGRVMGTAEPGDLVTIAGDNGRPLATAYYNPDSQISARILTWDVEQPIDESFWRGRLERAVSGRQPIANAHPPTSAYRLVHAEADGLPGLVVDRYNDTLVIQSLALGIDRRKEMLVALLADLTQPAGIIERSDVDVRQKEGLDKVIQLSWGESPPEEMVIQENGLRFLVDVWRGHKTGFYLDQRPNRAAVCRPSYVGGKEILNVFAYTGAFSVYAVANGAARITNVDSSIAALELAERNVAMNNETINNEQCAVENEYIAGDAFEVLRYFRDEGRRYDVVILDPPKFAYSQGGLERACRGYKDLNWLALGLLRPGGLLATFSCSGLVSAELFQKVVFAAAVDAHCDGQIIEHLTQGPDHPVLLTFPESAYLKGLLCRVWS